MISITLYILALVLLLLSTIKNHEKTKKSLQISGRAFLKMLPGVSTMLIIIGLSLALLDQETISAIMGAQSGLLGVFLAMLVGSFAVLPSFITFPLANSLIEAGAGYAQVAALVSTLMAVGIISFPMEVNYFNLKIAFWRVSLTLVMCIVFTGLVGMVM